MEPSILAVCMASNLPKQLTIIPTFFERLYIDDEPVRVTCDVLNPPFDEIQDAGRAFEARQGEAASHALKLAISDKAGSKDNSHRAVQAAVALEDQTPVFADLYSVNVSSKRVMVELLRRYSNTSEAFKLPQISTVRPCPVAPPRVHNVRGVSARKPLVSSSLTTKPAPLLAT